VDWSFVTKVALSGGQFCHYLARMIHPNATTLEANGIRLEPLSLQHATELSAAAADGKLWELWYTTVPGPEQITAYLEHALLGQESGHMLPWVVRDIGSGQVLGTTRYHDIIAAVDRVEIGYTWYAKRCQRTHVNTTCKLMLLEHAFETLGCQVVGLRTDNFNFTSQRAIEALGAKRDGVIRHHFKRRDGSVRDTVMYSILRGEWPGVRTHLRFRLGKHGLPKV
jgi:RimJ/RimL family protein N-acetyltransferase